MTAVNTPGRHKLTTRFTSIVRICSIRSKLQCALKWKTERIYFSYPTQEELGTIYGALLTPVLQRSLESHPTWSSPAKASQLAGTMVRVYDEVRQKFKADDFGHYLFTPRDLTRWSLGLLRYDLAEAGGDRVIEILCYEGCRLFRDRLVSTEEKNAFENILLTAIRTDWSAKMGATKDAGYFVSFGAPGGCSPGAPLPPFGKPLGHLSAEDFVSIAEKGINRFSEICF